MNAMADARSMHLSSGMLLLNQRLKAIATAMPQDTMRLASKKLQWDRRSHFVHLKMTTTGTTNAKTKRVDLQRSEIYRLSG